MGTLALTDFRNEVRYICGGIDASSPIVNDARLNWRVNASYLWVSMPNHYRHPELEIIELVTLAANTSRYALTNTYYDIVGVAHAEDATPDDTTRRTKLSPMDPRDTMTVTRPTSKPTHYAYWDERLYINCLPATAYVGQRLEVYGYMQPDILEEDDDTTLLKTEWDEVITWGAVWRTWMSLGEDDRAYEARQNFGQLVSEIADLRRMQGEDWGWETGTTNAPYMRNS